MNKKTTKAFNSRQPTDEWWAEVEREKSIKQENYYNNPLLGEPTFENGFDAMWEEGFPPYLALKMWKEYQLEEGE